MRNSKKALAATGTLAFALALSACGGGSSALSSGSSATKAASDTIVVGSANFQENILLADIYADALSAKGVKVTKKLNISSREVYLKALQDGSIDLVPEYNGYLLGYYDKTSTTTDPDQVLAALKTKLPPTLTVLNQAAAEDTDALVVTKETATKYHLTSIADVAPYAKKWTVGGPPEWKTRATGLPGLKSKYGLSFKKFISMDPSGPVTVTALEKGRVNAANIFTTDPNIVAKGWVALQDPKHVFLAANVIPVITKSKVTPTVSDALNAVSAKLDTNTLVGLDKKVILEKQDPETVAKDWLSSAGLA